MSFPFPDTCTQTVDLRQFKSEEKDKNHVEGREEDEKSLATDFFEGLNTARQQMCDSLALQPSSLTTIQTIEKYLSYLQNLIDSPNCENKNRGLEKFKWKAVLSKGIRLSLSKNVVERPMVSNTSIWYEAVCSVLSLGYTMANIGNKLSAQGAAMTDSSCSESIDWLCKASGVFHFLAYDFVPRWRNKKDTPPDCTTEVLMAVSEVLLGDANHIVMKQAQRKGLSAAAILKLGVAIFGKYREAANFLQRLSKSNQEELSESFFSYVVDGAKYIESSVLRQFALIQHEAGENGCAVACITFAHNNLVSLLKSNWEPYRRNAEGMLGEFESLRSQFVRINNNVTFQRVISIEEAKSRLPEGYLMVAMKPYNLPKAI